VKKFALNLLGSFVLSMLLTTVIDGAVQERDKDGCNKLNTYQQQSECLNALKQQRNADFLPTTLGIWFLLSVGFMLLNKEKAK
jgi:hypothetical protein